MDRDTGVWPHEFLAGQVPSVRAPNQFRVFIISPFEPKAWMDSIEQLVREACDFMNATFGTTVTGPGGKPLDISVRADRIRSAGVIHAEIWESLAHSDVVVADISGLNPNVLFELGAVAVRLPKERVILLREESEAEERAFDLSPVRHHRYTRSVAGIADLKKYLGGTLLRAVTSLMLGARADDQPLLPFRAELKAADSPWLYSPAECHRRVTPRCLEFGGIDYQQSFLSVGAVRLRDVRVEAVVRFTKTLHIAPENRAFIGVSVRAEHPLANFSNMLFVRETGVVARTVPNFAPPQGYRDDELTAQLGRVDTASGSIRLVNEISGDRQFVEVNGRSATFDLSSDRRRDAGYIFIQAWMCIAGLESLSVEAK